MKKILLCVYALTLGFFLLLCLNSCQTTRTLAYFNNIRRDSTSIVNAEDIETTIVKDDILHISIFTPDQTTSLLLNAPTLVNTGGAVQGYLVDDSGVIKLPLIGPIKAQGLTKRQLADKITRELLDQKIAKEPIVTVRIVNYRVTMMGEVARPSVVPVVNEHITLPEALAAAGDLTPYGKRGSVLLIREADGKRIYKRFSLNSTEMFNKDIYNLQNGDIIYVEPNNARAASTDRSVTVIPLALSVISFLLVLYLQFIRH